jgi:hypothetical protein
MIGFFYIGRDERLFHAVPCLRCIKEDCVDTTYPKFYYPFDLRNSIVFDLFAMETFTKYNFIKETFSR